MAEPERSAAHLLRAIPQVDRLLGAEEMKPLLAAHSRDPVVRELRRVLEGLRRAKSLEAADLTVASISRRVAEGLARRALPYYRRIVNGTGVVLHTGIGRAVLAPEAVAALAELAGHPQRVEIDLETGGRGGRDEGCAVLLRELTGCEDATVVNNNAAATLLMLAATARGKGVILSRGELVEIGGSFRIPDVMSESGALLVEVGTTNRTHLRDYAGAVGESTGMILKVHTSNYRIEGFTAEVEIEDLVALGREHGVPVAHDLGSGCAVDLAAWGPQAGILLGRREAVERCRRHPLFRAVRPGRLVYTALEATLRLYGEGGAAACERVPALRQLTAPAATLRARAEGLARELATCPEIAVSGVAHASRSAQELAAWLRTGDPAILVRVHEDAVLFDVRTLGDDELPLIAHRLRD